jgi:hypothetical protein
MKPEFKISNQMLKKRKITKKLTISKSLPKHLSKNQTKNKKEEKTEPLNKISKMEDKNSNL